MTQYQIGARAERYLRERLRRKGYFVMRSAGSKSPVDLIAGNGKEVLAIQVKRRRYMREGEKLLLADAAKKLNAIPVFAYLKDGRWTMERVG